MYYAQVGVERVSFSPNPRTCSQLLRLELLFLEFLSYLITCWLCWVFVAVRELSLVVASGGSSLGAVLGILIAVASRCGARALGRVHHSSCGSWALELRLSTAACGLSCPMACGAILDQGLNLCFCIGRWILNH